MSSFRIYLAGPDLFCQDAAERYALLQALCAERGLVGLSPADGSPEVMAAMLHGHLDRTQLAGLIAEHNMNLLASSDGVLANFMPFRGSEPDSGTVWEAAHANAARLPVVGYSADPQPLAQRVRAECGACASDDPVYGPIERDQRYGMMIEDYGLPLNLMISSRIAVFADPREALDALREQLELRDRSERQRAG